MRYQWMNILCKMENIVSYYVPIGIPQLDVMFKLSRLEGAFRM